MGPALVNVPMYSIIGTATVSWGWVAIGVVLGIPAMLLFIFWLGRRYFKEMNLDDRGEWDAQLPHPFPKDMVVATYIRRKREHRHDRHFYRRRAKGGKGGPGILPPPGV